MSKQIYVDSNGNETEYGGSVNYGSILPISPSDSTNTKDYIDNGLSGKANTSTFARKSVSTTGAITVAANTIDTQDFTVNDSNYNIVVGFIISNSINFAMVQCYFENSTTIRTRVRNLANTSDSYQIRVFYI